MNLQGTPRRQWQWAGSVTRTLQARICASRRLLPRGCSVACANRGVAVRQLASAGPSNVAPLRFQSAPCGPSHLAIVKDPGRCASGASRKPIQDCFPKKPVSTQRKETGFCSSLGYKERIDKRATRANRTPNSRCVSDNHNELLVGQACLLANFEKNAPAHRCFTSRLTLIGLDKLGRPALDERFGPTQLTLS